MLDIRVWRSRQAWSRRYIQNLSPQSSGSSPGDDSAKDPGRQPGLAGPYNMWTSESTVCIVSNDDRQKKSKCCCIYQKPRNWDESSSDDENEDHDCQNCRGHRKSDFNKNKTKKDNERQEQVCNDLESININSTQICQSNNNNNINKMETNQSK